MHDQVRKVVHGWKVGDKENFWENAIQVAELVGSEVTAAEREKGFRPDEEYGCSFEEGKHWQV